MTNPIIITTLLTALVVAGGLNLGCDDERATTPADDPERELAEQELEAERQAQEQNRQTREGLQDAAATMRGEQSNDPAAAAGGRDAYQAGVDEDVARAREAKAKAAGFDTWEQYQQSLNGGGTARPN